MTRQISGKRRALLQEAGDVEQLRSELTRQAVCDGAVDWPSQRRYLVCCAALADNHAGSLQWETGFAAADLAVLGLLEWDREHGTQERQGGGRAPRTAGGCCAAWMREGREVGEFGG